MNALRLSLRYGHGDLAWADRLSASEVADILAVEAIDRDAASLARRKATEHTKIGRGG